MPTDPRARIFRPLSDFERTLTGQSAAEVRAAKIAFVADGLALYREEQAWADRCRPPYWVQCLIPPLWPVLWYRGQLSRMTLLALAAAIERCRRSWGDDLRDAELSFDDLPVDEKGARTIGERLCRSSMVIMSANRPRLAPGLGSWIGAEGGHFTEDVADEGSS